MSDFVTPWTARFLCPWNSLGKNTEVGSHSLLHGIVPTQGSNPDHLHYRQILYHLSQQESPQDRAFHSAGREFWFRM